ncbi:uncharacterized protein CIMG_05997 [Coccidioides immitis RS]|uniref:Uncharacterized protein n=3 Tax=Coccidioides immitis TaxID=5501 RepID=A0A0E1S1N1_COCIM|nr:uncharacterized protein CIMG_05997 [Coccidioides immitis RS]EAS30518.2 hypothetical protein CIMG_05997 [Coccidioides immitis RS]KMP03063.1 hypothetical protein CIRG_02755 [Coccidioides immitis RMSCC 2394]KMU76160.1 hypothetical protein CISG_05528 [Coccidioides immitis RMSCC 3703]TPX23460.1 hypothetical protein DIZ76_012792 [Coccidioides immitis]
MADMAIHHTEPAPAHHPPAKSGQQADAASSTSTTFDHKGASRMPTYISSGSEERESKLPQQLLSRRSSIDIDDYFVGPRNLDRHSKWPTFLRLHGSVMPRMIIPLILMSGWATLITVITKFVHKLGVSSILLTVLGFVVGLSLSLRSSTAYERYAEGRKYWALLMQSSRTLARIIWIHNEEREGEEGKEDILAKLTGINLIVAFAVALKHKLRFEPNIAYDDLADLVGHLDTFAKEAHDPNDCGTRSVGGLKAIGQYLSVPMAISNPRKAIKKSKKPLGNLPVEILSYLSAYVDELMNEGKIRLPVYQSQAGTALYAMEEVMTGTERVLNTPLPLAYTILISQITWIYVLILPFQLVEDLGWITIPGCVVATYIIQGIAAICAEIENPFGNDVNDLPLDIFCEQLAADLDVITSSPPPKPQDFISRRNNLVLQPLSKSGVDAWRQRSIEDLRAALKAKATVAPATMAISGSRGQVLGANRISSDVP